MHGLPLGAKYAFTMRRMTQLELVDEMRVLPKSPVKQGPLGLEKEEVEDPFLAKGVRYVADGYDAISSAMRWSANATPSSCISTKARRFIARSAIARRPSAWSVR
jgi:flagellar motor component MotA